MATVLLSQTDLDDALEGFRKKYIKVWTDEDKHKDHKVMSHIHLHVSNVGGVGGRVHRCVVSKARINLHVKRSN